MPNTTDFRLPRANKISFVDYTPAELRKGEKDWIILYYCKNPLTQKLERQRMRAPMMSNARERERHCKKIIAEINRKLAEGWSPWLETSAKGFKTFRECCDTFIQQLEKEIKDGIKREDTLRSYKSFLSMINAYIKEKKIKLTFALEVNKEFVVNYLDWIYYDRKNSPRTYNNHLLFLKTFCNYMIGRGYLKENPTKEIPNKANGKKKRIILSERHKEKLRRELPLYNRAYYVLCMMDYYSFIRRTELTKLKVKDIDLDRNIIFVDGSISKNRKDEAVTIPEELKPLLVRHLAEANKYDFAFSANDFKPGAMQLKPKKISDTFSIIRKKLELPDNLQWYSFKDTGITDLFELGVSSLKIRDQARHKELKTTEIYTPRSKGGEAEIVKSGAKF